MTATQLSETDRAEILERYRKGQSVHQLAAHFGVSHMAILRALPADEPRRPVGFRQRPDVSTTDVVELRDSGLTWEQVGARVGLSLGGARKRYLTAARRAGQER